MMPVIRPIEVPEQPVTEYRAEQLAFVEMEAAARRARGDAVARWCRAWLVWRARRRGADSRHRLSAGRAP